MRRDAPAVIGAFHCRPVDATFFVLAFDRDGSSSFAELAALARQFGCPTDAGPELAARRSPCDVGVTELCEDPPLRP
jgi:hypothetical protein